MTQPLPTLQLFDGYFPALKANDYTITLTHSVSGPESPSYTAAQDFTVQAPEFSIVPGVVQSYYPPDGGSSIYDETLPFVVLADPSLPWERSVAPDAPQLPDPSNPQPWIALVLFTADEVVMPPDAPSPVVTTTVRQLLADDASVLKPQIPSERLTAAQLASQCRTVTVTAEAFAAVMPSAAELRYLAHCRKVSMGAEPLELASVLLANRLPQADTRAAAPAAQRYYAFVVSLEGLGAYLGPNGAPIAPKTGVQLVSLFDWSFVSVPDVTADFKTLVSGLIASEAATPALRLPGPAGKTTNPSVLERLNDGYVPLTLVAGGGDRSFAWYRGPFTPVVAQPVTTAGARSADELMIYLEKQGLFDLGYAAAWNLGRNLALADAAFAQHVNTYRLTAHQTANTLANRIRLGMAVASGGEAPAGRGTAHRDFARRIGGGLGRRWTDAVACASGSSAAPSRVGAPHVAAPRAPIAPQAVLAIPGAAETLSESLHDVLDAISAWLAKLSLLQIVPFSYLVPDPRMLPPESIRFFYVDPAWIDALIAGALSIGIHSAADAALLDALRPNIDSKIAAARRGLVAQAGGTGAPAGIGMTGVLIRSQLVANSPQLVVNPTQDGVPVTIVRNDCPSFTVRLCLFHGAPDAVSIAEPYEGLRFGVEDGREVYPRCVTEAVALGSQLLNVPAVTAALRTPPAGALGGVLDVEPLAGALASATGVLPYTQSAVVQWNGTPVATSYADANKLTATVPSSLLASPGSASITVAAGGVTSHPLAFTVSPAFALDELSPSAVQSGSGEFTLTAYGAGFEAGAIVLWNGTQLSTTVISGTQAIADVPAALIAAPGASSIAVRSGASTTNAVTLSIVATDPVIASIGPAIATAGSAELGIAVDGSGFESDAVVQWNGAALATAFTDAAALTAVVPATLLAGAGAASVTVLTKGATSNAVTFTVAGTAPAIATLRPNAALAGGPNDIGTLFVDGANFAPDAQVRWNATALTTTFDDRGQLTAVVPAALLKHAGSAAITVSSGGTTSNAATFTIFAPQPSAGLVVPNIAPAGSGDLAVTVYGGFGAADFALQMVKAPEQQTFVPAGQPAKVTMP